MNILILGATGYLGSKVTHALVKQKYNIVCTKRPKSDLSSIEDLCADNMIKLIPATVEAIDASLQYSKFDLVINLACNYGRSEVLYDGVIESNVEFPLKVLNKVSEAGVRKFITIGTGLPDDLNMYSFSKKIFSDFGRFYVEKHGIDFYSMKLEMFYGSDEPRDRFIPNLICNMLEGNEINVTLGTQHRDIIFIEDVVDAIIRVIHSQLKGYWEIPVGTGIAPAISELVDYIWEETGKKAKINWGGVKMRDNEPDCIADTSILNRIGEWDPMYWKDGIRKMISDISAQMEH